MMNLIQKYFRKDLSHKDLIRKKFESYFFSIPEHQWIQSTVTRTHFEKMFSHLPIGLIETMLSQHPISFVPSDLYQAKRQPGTVLTNTIIIFPEFQKLIASNKRAAVAYLAHELAFLLYEIESAKIDPMMAEVGADKFVCDLGLADELEELLLMLDETIEKRLRLTYLTINHFTSDN